ncbi:type II/IV secretion system ATPase subunit [Candidatus Woesearchaeota archaeon]|nr:type II/IV secretion system ATPase subunit [Candidatus Woesearchaeota archaeon]
MASIDALKQYVAQAIQKQDSATIRQNLIKGRWPAALVDEALNSAKPGAVLDRYDYSANNLPVSVTIERSPGEFVPVYSLSIPSISNTTKLVLEKIRQELITTVDLGIVDVTDPKRNVEAEQRFEHAIDHLIKKYFPDADEQTSTFLTAYLIQRSLGLGDIDNLMHDKQLEELAVNNADEPVWVYHRRWGWLKTTIKLADEDQIRHYATMIGRKANRQINVLEPLMDANLRSGDRVNATLMPVSARGNTLTLRKFASKPWTITDMLANGTISVEAAALIWEAIQYELSVLVSGGTASGKTSLLNALSNFFPPNQRILSIEDTRELQLASFLHWIPMVTRLPNQEGKGGVTMLDLLVNSLRMRPDRIVVGEIRRQREAEVLFEAIHTGHSVYATVHANTAQETVTRLTSPPISIPATMLPALSMIVVQYRNRRTGLRRIFQVAEMLENATPNVLFQYDMMQNVLASRAKSQRLLDTLQLFAGIGASEIQSHLAEKARVLKWLVKQQCNTVDAVGKIMAQYYVEPEVLLRRIP